jgi:FkbM family methyltransferase
MIVFEKEKENHAEEYEKLMVWEFFGFSQEGFFIDIGANDPKNLSQSWFLEKMGWRGILIEPLPEKNGALLRERPLSRVFQVAVSAPDKIGEADFFVSDMKSSLNKNLIAADVDYQTTTRVKVVTLDSILEEIQPPRIDFVSIDTEGTELDVLRGFNLEKWKPSLILMEDVLLSLTKHRYLIANGYKIYRRTGFNSWYIRRGSGHNPSLMERLKLFRKYYLGTPLRRFKHNRESRI